MGRDIASTPIERNSILYMRYKPLHCASPGTASHNSDKSIYVDPLLALQAVALP